MWQYEKKLQYPVNIKNPNPKYAKIIISQYGGPDGELGASMRYLTQRFGEALGLTTDRLNSKNFYACNPNFDKGCGKQ
ncbi:MAG: manganese catalase family protein [Clostridia bacterium]|nr:manganese catalase family protein [Clostridia bacterium]MBR4116518.1 manganese catalase family protein [Clostridia bacterium]